VRLTVELDGKPTVVEVSDDLSTVTVGGRSVPVRLVDRGPERVELEIGGETVIVRGWPEGQSVPPGPVDVNGERYAAQVRLESAGSRPLAHAAVGPGAGPQAPAPAEVPATVPPGSAVVVPPMPGRVVEVRVQEGAAVAKGAVLLVVEAMKMRNEVTAPLDGIVRDLRAREGANVRAKEPLLTVVPR
jgi:glutaconyl-CoA/methylmalonyl-CoA decarboxylase subunit gamma